MPPTASREADLYLAAFVARCRSTRPIGQELVDQPGVVGLRPSAENPVARLLVTDDRAHDVVAGLLPDAGAGMITVFAQAPRCRELVRRRTGWLPQEITAMVCTDLASVPAAPLPGELTLRPVRRVGDDPADGIPLEAAVATAARADPRIRGTGQALAAYLRSLPHPTRLLAAVDRAGAVRATAGCTVFGAIATVMFVNTDPGWRNRGVGRAMTAEALRAACDTGSTSACLDASDAARSLYERLGFAVVSPATRFAPALGSP